MYFVSIVVFWFVCPYVVCTRYLTIYQVFDNVWLFAIGGVCDYVSFSPSDFVDNLAGIVTMHFTRDLQNVNKRLQKITLNIRNG